MSIDRIAVLGAGTMGHGIAYVAVVAGYRTTLYDVSAVSLERAQRDVQGLTQRGVERGTVSAAEASAILPRLSTTANLEQAVHDAPFVIEAVPERIDVKLDTLSAVERYAPPHAVLATNTSALSITEMAAVLDDPGRMAGMHFFNPVHTMRLVEVVCAAASRQSTIDAIVGVAVRMGKETVIVRESPGFVTTRINAMIGNEAFYILQAGIASARDIDKAVKLGLNHPMGPFELVDIVGLDTRLSILQHLHRTLGEKFRPCPLLEQYVREGRLGKKVGKGVYDY